MYTLFRNNAQGQRTHFARTKKEEKRHIYEFKYWNIEEPLDINETVYTGTINHKLMFYADMKLILEMVNNIRTALKVIRNSARADGGPRSPSAHA